jgi:hypothetical protein
MNEVRWNRKPPPPPKKAVHSGEHGQFLIENLGIQERATHLLQKFSYAFLQILLFFLSNGLVFRCQLQVAVTKKNAFRGLDNSTLREC